MRAGARPMIAIPPERLDPDLLQAVIEAFVLREGTEYGAREYGLDEKCAMVRRALERGEVTLCFDPESESTTLVPTEDLPPEARLPRVRGSGRVRLAGARAPDVADDPA